ncbi:MAG: methyltransferase domain-containing protein [Rhodanobacter sp.]
MNLSASDRKFAGSIPQLYEQYLVPLIFETYAADLCRRVALLKPTRILELAAGTGVLTRKLANMLPATTSIVATDLNQPMLDHAALVGTTRSVEWRQADAMHLPFPEETFDVVVCQFGVMFFPDKSMAFSESRRVLRHGGTFIFNVWDRIEKNEFADAVTKALISLFPADSPMFMARVPHGYHDLTIIAQDLADGGFSRAPKCDTVTAWSSANSPRIPALAYCQATPLRNEIEVRDPSMLTRATDIATAAIASRFGTDRVEGRIQAHIITIER